MAVDDLERERVVGVALNEVHAHLVHGHTRVGYWPTHVQHHVACLTVGRQLHERGPVHERFAARVAVYIWSCVSSASSGQQRRARRNEGTYEWAVEEA